MKNSLRSNLLKLWIYHCEIWKSLNICFAFVIMDFILFITSENSKILIKKENKNSLHKIYFLMKIILILYLHQVEKSDF